MSSIASVSYNTLKVFSDFSINVAGIQAFSSRPGHPQTYAISAFVLKMLSCIPYYSSKELYSNQFGPFEGMGISAMTGVIEGFVSRYFFPRSLPGTEKILYLIAAVTTLAENTLIPSEKICSPFPSQTKNLSNAEHSLYISSAITQIATSQAISMLILTNTLIGKFFEFFTRKRQKQVIGSILALNLATKVINGFAIKKHVYIISGSGNNTTRYLDNPVSYVLYRPTLVVPYSHSITDYAFVGPLVAIPFESLNKFLYRKMPGSAFSISVCGVTLFAITCFGYLLGNMPLALPLMFDRCLYPENS